MPTLITALIKTAQEVVTKNKGVYDFFSSMRRACDTAALYQKNQNNATAKNVADFTNSLFDILSSFIAKSRANIKLTLSDNYDAGMLNGLIEHPAFSPEQKAKLQAIYKNTVETSFKNDPAKAYEVLSDSRHAYTDARTPQVVAQVLPSLIDTATEHIRKTAKKRPAQAINMAIKMYWLTRNVPGADSQKQALFGLIAEYTPQYRPIPKKDVETKFDYSPLSFVCNSTEDKEAQVVATALCTQYINWLLSRKDKEAARSFLRELTRYALEERAPEALLIAHDAFNQYFDRFSKTEAQYPAKLIENLTQALEQQALFGDKPLKKESKRFFVDIEKRALILASTQQGVGKAADIARKTPDMEVRLAALQAMLATCEKETNDKTRIENLMLIFVAERPDYYRLDKHPKADEISKQIEAVRQAAGEKALAKIKNFAAADCKDGFDKCIQLAQLAPKSSPLQRDALIQAKKFCDMHTAENPLETKSMLERLSATSKAAGKRKIPQEAAEMVTQVGQAPPLEPSELAAISQFKQTL